jgi:4-hydroxyphenylpyruvate dioxygenase
LLQKLGFTEVAHHRSKDASLFKQGDINFIINAEPHSQAIDFSLQHGPCACAMAFRVKNAAEALDYAVANGAMSHEGPHGYMELNLPAIEGIGGSLLYFVDRYGDNNIYDVDFKPVAGAAPEGQSAGLQLIDHLTHNVKRGKMESWANFYERIANFREIRYFDIQGKVTGLVSKAMTSPCGKIRIPINESTDNQSQIEEFLRSYRGEGIQHIALSTENIYQTVRQLRAAGVEFMSTPATYYQNVNQRVRGHRENLKQLEELSILIDGSADEQEGILLQIFTQTVIGPIFFEIIQRKGNEGFGEGNFQALFESIEEDQLRRGAISEK